MKAIIGLAVIALIAVCSWCLYLSQPVIVVSEATLLWQSEYDASRQFTIYPGPGRPLGQLAVGDRLRIVWSTYGKDYYAAWVVGPHWRKGWVISGQPGIALPP